MSPIPMFYLKIIQAKRCLALRQFCLQSITVFFFIATVIYNAVLNNSGSCEIVRIIFPLMPGQKLGCFLLHHSSFSFVVLDWDESD